jgi:hypothetical protein
MKFYLFFRIPNKILEILKSSKNQKNYFFEFLRIFGILKISWNLTRSSPYVQVNPGTIMQPL